jgi:hypothetical protein
MKPSSGLEPETPSLPSHSGWLIEGLSVVACGLAGPWLQICGLCIADLPKLFRRSRLVQCRFDSSLSGSYDSTLVVVGKFLQTLSILLFMASAVLIWVLVATSVFKVTEWTTITDNWMLLGGAFVAAFVVETLAQVILGDSQSP